MERLTKLLGYWNNSLPEKVDYADLVCAPAFTRGYRMVYEDEYGYVVEDTIKALEELQQYRRAEQNGLLLRLPCNVGDTVYNITGGKLSEETVIAINIGINRNKGSMGIITENFRYANVLHENIDFGYTVFLTKSEAEQALAERIDSLARQ